MSESKEFQLGTIGALSLSVVSSVSIVICNKALISTLGFTFVRACNFPCLSSFWVSGLLLLLICSSTPWDLCSKSVQFLVIGKTSPVTYQVLGHLKTCLVLAFCYVLLRDPFSWRNILGILIAVVGMVLYSYYCTVENQQTKANEVSALSTQPKESETDPLIGVENGSAVLADKVSSKSPGWNSNKDF